ncbi:MAG: transporter substrate-binding protein [Planctomycetes bacterium]|nr:transporter substrate-binding protein [Planctomycetota bacterium]
MVLLVAAVACGGSDPTAVPATGGSSGDTSGETIKIGVLHSLSGTMAISETAVRDATLLAIEEINAAGGVMGKQLLSAADLKSLATLPSKPELLGMLAGALQGPVAQFVGLERKNKFTKHVARQLPSQLCVAHRTE